MLGATLDRLRAQGKPWVVENVVGSGLPRQSTLDDRHGVLVCGSAFRLGVSGFDLPRHRLFETSFPVASTPCSHTVGSTLGVYGNGTNAWHRERFGRNIRASEMREAMGVDWMTRTELAQAVPPAFTEWVGGQMLEHMGFKRGALARAA